MDLVRGRIRITIKFEGWDCMSDGVYEGIICLVKRKALWEFWDRSQGHLRFFFVGVLDNSIFVVVNAHSIQVFLDL